MTEGTELQDRVCL